MTRSEIKQMVRDAYTLLAGSFVEGHLHGVQLLDKARVIDSAAVREVEAEIDAEATNHGGMEITDEVTDELVG